MLVEVVLPPGTIKRIHVNRRLLQQQARSGGHVPVYTVKSRGRSYRGFWVTVYGSLHFPEPAQPLPCGARVWGQTMGEVRLLTDNGEGAAKEGRPLLTHEEEHV